MQPSSKNSDHRRDPVRSAKLRVIGGEVELRDDVPRRRDECPTAVDRLGNRVCGHVKCEWHLWMMDRRDAPGRFRASLRSTLRPVWLEWPLPPACGADIVERAKAEGWSVAQIAHAIQLSARGMHWFLLKAKTKLRSLGATLPEFSDWETI